VRGNRRSSWPRRSVGAAGRRAAQINTVALATMRLPPLTRPSMDVAVLKALADDTRYASTRSSPPRPLMRFPPRAGGALGSMPTTISLLHLERLRDVGLVDLELVHRVTSDCPSTSISSPRCSGSGFRPAAQPSWAGSCLARGSGSGPSPTTPSRIGPALGFLGGPSHAGSLRAAARDRCFAGSVRAQPSGPATVRSEGPNGSSSFVLHCPFRSWPRPNPEPTTPMRVLD